MVSRCGGCNRLLALYIIYYICWQVQGVQGVPPYREGGREEEREGGGEGGRISVVSTQFLAC